MAFGAEGATRWLKALQRKYHLPCKNKPFVAARVVHRPRDRVTQQMHAAQQLHDAVAHRSRLSVGACGPLSCCVVDAASAVPPCGGCQPGVCCG
jgi:hypothetical protein